MNIKRVNIIAALNFGFHCELLTLMLECTFVREVKILERSLKQLQAESNRRDAKVYSNMFARMTKDTSMAIKVSGLIFEMGINFDIFIETL